MRQRPLSPHLQVYRLPITAVLSILHRLTGAGLFISLCFFIAWIASLAMGEIAYLAFVGFMNTWFGQTVILFSLFGFYYHFANGIRHLVWDMGYGYEMFTARLSGWVIVAVSISATLLTWRLA